MECLQNAVVTHVVYKVMMQQILNMNVSMFKDNIFVPPSVEHGGVWRLKPVPKRCKCVFSLIHHHTHSLFRWKVTQQEVTSVHSSPPGNEDDG